MVGLNCHASSVCLFPVLLACAFIAVRGEDRCRVTGGGSCTDPTLKALLSDATGSMLQVKVESAPDAPLKDVEDDMQLVAAQVAKEVESVEKEAEGAQMQIGAMAGNALSEIAEVEKAIEDTAPAEIERLGEEANEVFEEQVENAKVEGLKALKGASNVAAKKVDAVADSMEETLSGAETGIQNFKVATDGVLTAKAYQATGAIDGAVKAVEETVASIAPNAKLADQFKKGADQVMNPYVQFAKASIKAQKDEVTDVLSELSNEADDLGEEVHGIAGQVAQGTRDGADFVSAKALGTAA